MDKHISKPYSLHSDEGWIHRVGVDFIVKAGETRANGGAAVLEFVTRKGEEPGEHTHPTEDEMFYLLEGTLSVQCDGKTFDLKPGDFAFLPHGLPHNYTITSDDPVRLLVVTSPVREGTGGWGGFVGDLENGDDGEFIGESPSQQA